MRLSYTAIFIYLNQRQWSESALYTLFLLAPAPLLLGLKNDEIGGPKNMTVTDLLALSHSLSSAGCRSWVSLILPTLQAPSYPTSSMPQKLETLEPNHMKIRMDFGL